MSSKKINEYDLLIKVVVTGDSGVGKSAFVTRLIKDEFKEASISTIGVDFFNKKRVIDNKIYCLQIWDTAGQEKYRSITSNYYRGANVVIIMFDVTDKQSFDNVSNWITQAKVWAGENILIYVIANKCDKIEERVISKKIACKLADEKNVKLIYTSAKTGDNVIEIFDEITIDYAKSLYASKISPTSPKMPLLLKFKRPESKCCS